MATVQSSDVTKTITVRTTAFDAAATEGGCAAVESVDAADDAGLSSFVGQESRFRARDGQALASSFRAGGMQSGDNSPCWKRSRTSWAPPLARPRPP